MELFKPVDKKAMKLMNQIENKLDDCNGSLGDAGTLCLFCHSTLHNGKVGIVHHDDCPVQHIRNWIISNGGTLLP